MKEFSYLLWDGKGRETKGTEEHEMSLYFIWNTGTDVKIQSKVYSEITNLL